jgi:hypothetical protein
MTIAMSWTLLLVSGAIGTYGLLRPAGYILAPTLVALVSAAWFAPQLITLAGESEIPVDAHFDVAAQAILCTVSVFLGWKYGTSRPVPVTTKTIHFNVTALILPVFLLTVFAASMNILLERMAVQMAGISQWYGPIVIVAFFAQIRIVSLVLSLSMFLHQRTPMTITLLAANLLINIPVALISLRRTEMIDLAIAIVGALWFVRRWRVPLPFVLAGAMGMAVVVYSIGPLRAAQDQHFLRTGKTISLLNPEIWRSFDIFNTVGGSVAHAPDVRNAIWSTHLVNNTYAFSYGAVVWNGLVFQYVPAQIFGSAIKRDLMIDAGNLDSEYIFYNYGFNFQRGTTSTGIGSAYRDFGYFGFVYYLVMGFALARLFVHAMAGNLWMQAAYLSLVPFALTSITHGHDKFFVSWPLYAVVLIGLASVSNWCRPRRRRVPAQQG